jgi:hypothetical protein
MDGSETDAARGDATASVEDSLTAQTPRHSCKIRTISVQKDPRMRRAFRRTKTKGL